MTLRALARPRARAVVGFGAQRRQDLVLLRDVDQDCEGAHTEHHRDREQTNQHQHPILPA